MRLGDEKLVLWVLVSILVSTIYVVEAQRVPCYYIFGDSIADNGNNNGIPLTDAFKANFPPYGIDLPNVRRGRFTNGRTVADFIGKFLGFNRFIQPFRIARGDDLIQGVNYASGGAGIRDETGNRRGVTTLTQQIANHGRTIATLNSRFGVLTTQEDLIQGLYSIYVGSSDYINNYFKPNEYPTSRMYTPDQYATVLVQQYSEQIQALYALGARKITLNGLGLIGCIPLFLNGTSCAVEINNAAAIFNTKLEALVGDLNRRLPGANLAFIDGRSNATAALLAEIPNYGPCCDVESGEELCVILGNVCGDRDDYLFWDAVHTMEAANKARATVAYEDSVRLLDL